MAIGAGDRYTFYGVVNASGKVIGSTADGASAGAVQGLARLEGGRVFPTNIPDTDKLIVSGDDQPLVQFQFDPEGLPQGTLEFAVRNATFEALVQGTVVETVGEMTMGVLQPADRADVDLCFFVERHSKKWVAGARGVKAWEIAVIPRAQVVPQYTDIQMRTFNPYKYSMVMSKSDLKPWGASLTEGLNGTTQAPMFVIDADNPIFMDVVRGNASQTVFALTYAPKSAAKLAVFDLNGVKLALTTHYTLSGSTLTFLSAPASGYAAAFYEVDESLLS